MPDAALQCKWPTFHRVWLIAAVLKQGIDAVPVRNELHADAVALREPWSGGLLTEGKQCHSTGVAHAGSDAVNREQSPPQQFTAAVSATVPFARCLTHGWLSVLVAQPFEQRHLEKT